MGARARSFPGRGARGSCRVVGGTEVGGGALSLGITVE